MTYAAHAEALGLTVPRHSVSMTPNVTRPRSRGRVWLGSPDPDVPPLIDPRYFTDPEGHDERTLVAGMRMARRIAATEPIPSLTTVNPVVAVLMLAERAAELVGARATAGWRHAR